MRIRKMNTMSGKMTVMPKTVRQSVLRLTFSPPAASKTMRYRIEATGPPSESTRFVTYRDESSAAVWGETSRKTNEDECRPSTLDRSRVGGLDS